MSDLKGQIWMDGSFCDWKDAKIHILTHTMHYGTGVFEGVRAYEAIDGPAIFRLKEHTDRLYESADLVGMQACLTYSQSRQACFIVFVVQHCSFASFCLETYVQ